MKYVLTGILGVFDAVLLWILIGALQSGGPRWLVHDPADAWSTPVTVVWGVITLFIVVTAVLMLLQFTVRVDYYPDRLRTRRFLVFRTLWLTDATSIRFQDVNVALPAPGGKRRYVKVLRVFGKHRKITVADGQTNYDGAMAVIDQWVRARPELVRGGNAEAFFERRGVLS